MESEAEGTVSEKVVKKSRMDHGLDRSANNVVTARGDGRADRPPTQVGLLL